MSMSTHERSSIGIHLGVHDRNCAFFDIDTASLQITSKM